MNLGEPNQNAMQHGDRSLARKGVLKASFRFWKHRSTTTLPPSHLHYRFQITGARYYRRMTIADESSEQREAAPTTVSMENLQEETSPSSGDDVDADSIDGNGASGDNDNDDDDDVTVIILERGIDDGDNAPGGWADQDSPEMEERRRNVLLRELQRVQRASFIHFMILCLIPTSLLFIVIATVLGEDEDCESLATTCEKEARTFINAFTTRCVCDAITVIHGSDP